MNTKTAASTLFVLMATLSMAACSSDGQSSDRKGGSGAKGGKPPAAAFEACASKTEGQSCSVTSPRGEMSGTCKTPPKGTGALACVPTRKRKQ